MILRGKLVIGPVESIILPLLFLPIFSMLFFDFPFVQRTHLIRGRQTHFSDANFAKAINFEFTIISALPYRLGGMSRWSGGVGKGRENFSLVRPPVREKKRLFRNFSTLFTIANGGR